MNKIRHDYHGNKPKSAAAHAGGAVPKPSARPLQHPHLHLVVDGNAIVARPTYIWQTSAHIAVRNAHTATRSGILSTLACLRRGQAGNQESITSMRRSTQVRSFLNFLMYQFIKSNPNNPPYSIKATINDSPIPISLEIETGSGVTLINRSDFEKLGMPLTSLSNQPFVLEDSRVTKLPA